MSDPKNWSSADRLTFRAGRIWWFTSGLGMIAFAGLSAWAAEDYSWTSGPVMKGMATFGAVFFAILGVVGLTQAVWPTPEVVIDAEGVSARMALQGRRKFPWHEIETASGPMYRGNRLMPVTLVILTLRTGKRIELYAPSDTDEARRMKDAIRERATEQR